MTEPSWLPEATFAVSVLAAGGASYAAVITGRLNRAEAKRDRKFTEAEAKRTRAWTELQADRSRAEERFEGERKWERDRVTEHYLAAIRAARALQTVYTSRIEPTYASTPVGDWRSAWLEVDAAYGAMTTAIMEARAVARPAVLPVLRYLLDVDVPVMVPFAGTKGTTEVAYRRAKQEAGLLVERSAALVMAMRVDLGLASAEERQHLENLLASFQPKSERTLARAVDPDELRATLRSYSVAPLIGAGDDYSIAASPLSRYQLAMPALQRAPLAALLLSGDDLLAGAVSGDLAGGELVGTLQAMVRCVESGLRKGPGERDAPDGNRVTAWFREELDGHAVSA